MYLELYIMFCLIVGVIGTARKIGFFLSFLISLFASPIIGILVVIISPAKPEPSLIWYRCKHCGFRSQINHIRCPQCSLTDDGTYLK